MAKYGKLVQHFKEIPKYPNLERAYEHGRKIASAIAVKNDIDLTVNDAAEEEIKKIYEVHRRNKHRVSSHQLAMYIIHKYFGLSQDRIAEHYGVNRSSVKSLILKSVKLIGGSEINKRPLEGRISKQNFYANLEDALTKAQEVHSEIIQSQPKLKRGERQAVTKEAQILHQLHVENPKKITAKRLMVYLLRHIYSIPTHAIATHYGVALSGVNHTYQQTVSHLNDYLEKHPDALNAVESVQLPKSPRTAKSVAGFSETDKTQLATRTGNYSSIDGLIHTINGIRDEISQGDRNASLSRLAALHKLHIQNPKTIRDIHLELYGAHFVHNISPHALGKHYGLTERTVRALIKEASDALE